ncbi:hypothetical protein [Burkholderia cenocepacia]|uniref:hypothetical protein n=1 Tax=Burkholderia cenocepacia TaxID=95486 RepID=UPI0015C53E54|nr:hypothetical protein [Burkholderia cenocepacia]
MKRTPCYCALDAAAELAAALAAVVAGAALADVAVAASGAGASCAGTVFTVAPGRTLSTPCTIT